MDINGLIALYIGFLAFLVAFFRDFDNGTYNKLHSIFQWHILTLKKFQQFFTHKKSWGTNPKGLQAFEFSYMLAVGYSILAFMFSYIFGGDGTLMGIQILPQKTFIDRMYVFIFILLTFINNISYFFYAHQIKFYLSKISQLRIFFTIFITYFIISSIVLYYTNDFYPMHMPYKNILITGVNGIYYSFVIAVFIATICAYAYLNLAIILVTMEITFMFILYISGDKETAMASQILLCTISLAAGYTLVTALFVGFYLFLFVFIFRFLNS